jgi:hypothetical protein
MKLIVRLTTVSSLIEQQFLRAFSYVFLDWDVVTKLCNNAKIRRKSSMVDNKKFYFEEIETCDYI